MKRRFSPALCGQRGSALLVLFLVLGIAAAALLVSALTRQSNRIESDTRTVNTLAQARDALIGYAANYRTVSPNDVLGYLPLPDVGTSPNEGEAAGTVAGSTVDSNLIGRLPWKTLGLPDIRDGSGGCLWYAVSGRFKNNPMTATLNWDTQGQFDLMAEDGVTPLANNVVAVVFAPGIALSGQNRAAAAANTPTCGGNYNAANYLDTPNAGNAINGILNYYPGTANSGVAPNSTNKSLVTQANGSSYNDRMLAITVDDLFRVIMQRADFKSDIEGLLQGLQSCLNGQSSAPAASVNNKGADALDTCGSGLSASMQKVYTNWKNNLLYAKLPTPTVITLNGAPTPQPCSAVVLFGGQRTSSQQRITPTQQGDAAQYLEGGNVTSFKSNGTAYAGWNTFDKTNPSRDLVACIVPSSGTSQKIDFSNISNDFNFTSPTFTQGQMVKDIGNQSVLMGIASRAIRNFPATCPVNSNQCRRNLYGCLWSRDTLNFASGFRAYFKFNINPINSGFTFSIADAAQNPAPGGNASDMCGAAAEDLGYSGNNLTTPTVKPPKLALEIDTSQEANFRDNKWRVYQDSCNCLPTQVSGNTYRFTSLLSNAVFSPNYDSARGGGTYYLSNIAVSGNGFTAQLYRDAARTRPFTGVLLPRTYTFSYAAPYGTYNNARNDPDNRHAALDYWGFSRPMTTPVLVNHPDSEDNVHGLGFAPQSAANPDPFNPNSVPGVARVNSLQTQGLDHYVRIEVKRLNDYDGTRRSYQIKAWVFNNNDPNLNTTGKLAAFKNTALDYGNLTGNGFTGINNTGNAYTFTDTNANFAHPYTALTLGSQTYYLNTTSVAPSGTYFKAQVFTDAGHSLPYTGPIATGTAYQLQFTPPAATLSPGGYVPLVVYDLTAGQEAMKTIRVGFTVGASGSEAITISNFILETIP